MNQQGIKARDRETIRRLERLYSEKERMKSYLLDYYFFYTVEEINKLFSEINSAITKLELQINTPNP